MGNAYNTLLKGIKAQRSHSRRGECYDNAQAESLWSRLKTEELEARDWLVFADLADAQGSVSEYFDYLIVTVATPVLATKNLISFISNL